MLKGLKERIELEVKKLVPTENVQLYFDSHRRYATWIGGSMISSMSTFSEYKITQQAYRESGNRTMVLKKAF